MSVRRRIAWARKHPGGYEVSSRGDSRFSALYARLPNGQTIEDAYQSAKGSGKGQPATVADFRYWETYVGLWRQWAAANPTLMALLRTKAEQHDYTLTDRFALTANNQARALAHLLNET